MTGTAAQQAERLALLVLSAASGAVDTFTFLCLGKVFAGVMTGNLVLIGVSVATSDGTQAIRALAALAGYCAGVATAALIADRLPRRTVLAGEAVLLTLSATCWALATDRSGTLLWALLVTNALAMGLQARTWGTPTTYFTGTSPAWPVSSGWAPKNAGQRAGSPPWSPGHCWWPPCCAGTPRRRGWPRWRW